MTMAKQQEKPVTRELEFTDDDMLDFMLPWTPQCPAIIREDKDVLRQELIEYTHQYMSAGGQIEQLPYTGDTFYLGESE